MSGNTPILSKYQNKRRYLKQWWNVVNWNEINKRFEMSSPLSSSVITNIDNSHGFILAVFLCRMMAAFVKLPWDYG